MDAGPVRDLQLGKALLHGGGQLRIGRDALRPGGGQGLELAFVEDVGQGDDAGLRRALHLPAQHGRRALRPALVGHGLQLGAVLHVQHLGHEMRRAARAGRGEIEALALLRCLDEIAQVLVGRVLGNHDHGRRQADHGHRNQRIVLERHGLLDHAVGDHASRAHQQGVAVGLGLGHDVGAHRASRTRAVVDHHGLAQDPGRAFGSRSCHQVIGAACRERHHQANGAGGPGIGGAGSPCSDGAGHAGQRQRGGKQGGQGGAAGQAGWLVHGVSWKCLK